MMLCITLFCLIAFLNGIKAAIVVHSKSTERFLWFTCIGESDRAYMEFEMVALESASQHSPSLLPVVVVSGSPSEIPQWLHHMHDQCDLILLNHNVSFAAEVIRFRPERAHKLGPYLRLDIPLIADSIVDHIPSKCSYQWNKEYVIYTDTDVMIIKDVNPLVYQPPILSAGAEVSKDVIANTGVLIINIPQWKQIIPDLLQYANLHKWTSVSVEGSFDQWLTLDYIKENLQNKVSLLPNELNWKPYWAINSNAVIVHFHGPKPKRYADCYALLESNYHAIKLASYNISTADSKSDLPSVDCVDEDVDRIYREQCSYRPYYNVLIYSSKNYNLTLCQQAQSYRTYLSYYYHSLHMFKKKIQAFKKNQVV